MIEHGTFYAGGRWIASASADRLDVVDPADGAIIARTPAGTSLDVDAAVSAARSAASDWAATPVAERLALLRALRDAVAMHSEDLAGLITRQMGTPIAFSRAAQIGLPLRTFDVTIAAMEQVEAEERVGRSTVLRDPVGIVAAITPWNFPLHQIAAKVVPALAAGCVVILKPSELTPLDAIRFTELLEECGFLPGVFNLVLGGPATGAALVAHPAIDMVSFTGSTAAGRTIAAEAGGGLKKVALELGGKSANILLDDVDLALVVPQALGQCFVNAGQTCAALTRLIVPAGRLADVEALAATHLVAWLPGDPSDAATRMGPLASHRQRDRVRALVDAAVADGATLIQPEGRPAAPNETGAWFPPTIVTGARPDMAICREEVFGPVLVILPYANEDEAVSLANDSAYGLSGGVWSTDLARAGQIARRLRTGQVILNGAMLDMEAPFGGVGQSGLGRENGRHGLEEFFILKAITRPTA